MFVLPPPPRYTNGALYNGLPGGVGLLETTNKLEHPTGPDYQLVVGEGTYVLRDDLLLATPPPHPSDAPQPNNNPLATTVSPPTAGTKLSVVVISPRNPPSHALFRSAVAQGTRNNITHSIQEEVSSPKSDAGSAHYYNQLPAFGDQNPALAPVVTKGNKKDQKAKPKNNMVKSNSSYVSRVIPHENMQKRITERSPQGLFAFANVNRAFMWLDLSSETKTDNMAKVLFTKAHVLAHAVNEHTKSIQHLDLALGFNTSDIIWYEPVTQKYARLNKNGVINQSAVAAIAWLPRKENLFVAAHFDGTLVVYDKEKEDAEFVKEESVEADHANGASKVHFHVLKSVQSRNQKTNPVAVWKVSNLKANNLAFSPDGQLLAIVSEDGCLTILDYINEKVLDVFRSYYGALTCVTWSPDGRYVLTGGQDDLISIWSIAERALVARCVGHDSWVTDIKFDTWRCDERNYRFGSVGEDCRLLLWDFSVGMLGRPKNTSVRHRGSVSSHGPGVGGHQRKESSQSIQQVRTASTLATVDSEGDGSRASEVVHAVDSKSSTAILPPVMSKIADKHPLMWVGFEEHCIITSCIDGHVREWDRPKEGSGDNQTTDGSSLDS
ncbi:Hypothetical protein R9X50_00139900 [Acrodontium crateriforme]|uniref:Anaphase-promoting complex subunit 4-like WD40 domain-containing protein n=1 Tax=Acrodontium crateriforme TaxID=150365 RepID=A0AAQ3M533_9PEZI|nr:Hypothetical protein R9X50_00139900 [Acrodontium crateriforme]